MIVIVQLLGGLQVNRLLGWALELWCVVSVTKETILLIVAHLIMSLISILNLLLIVLIGEETQGLKHEFFK